MADNDATLVLALAGPDAASSGAAARKAFGPEGGTVGSGQDCDWTLSDLDRTVTEHHARIVFARGRYSVVDTSPNGVFVNESPRPLGLGASAALSVGDELRIGLYRLVVEAAPGASAAPPPLDDLATPASPGGASSEPLQRRAAAAPGPERLLSSPADSDARLSSAGVSESQGGSTLSDEWERHLAGLLGPTTPGAGNTNAGGATGTARRDGQPTNGGAEVPRELSSPSLLGSGSSGPGSVHGPLTALLSSGGASGAASQAPPPPSASWGGPERTARPSAPPSAMSEPASAMRGTGTFPFAAYPAEEEEAQSTEHNGPKARQSSAVAVWKPNPSPWDASGPEGFAEGVLRGTGLALPALSERQLGALGYDLGRALGALADLLVEVSQQEGQMSQQEDNGRPDPFSMFPTGLLALSELVAARGRGGGSIEAAVRASTERLRGRRKQERHLLKAVSSKLQERRALKTALAQLDPQRLTSRYGLKNSRRKAVKARAWDIFKAHYPEIVEFALARRQGPRDGLADPFGDADTTH